eukprot:sb/3470383/
MDHEVEPEQEGIRVVTSSSSALSLFQQQFLTSIQFDPAVGTWKVVDLKLPITNYELQRYVSSIISHRSSLFYVHKNYVMSADPSDPDESVTKVAMISNMFSDMSNYWLFASGDKIVLMGGMFSAQGGSHWDNKEVLIFNLSTKSWMVIQNRKPSPMYEMLSGMTLDNKIYTVSHSCTGSDSIAKMEYFDLEDNTWKKSINLNRTPI